MGDVTPKILVLNPIAVVIFGDVLALTASRGNVSTSWGEANHVNICFEQLIGNYAYAFAA